MALGALLLVLTLVAYKSAIGGGFIWDDDDYVTENVTLRSAAGLGQIWLSPLSIPQYYPLTHTTYWIEYHLWQLDPAGYHVDNVLLHGASALLLWWLLARLNIPGAALAAFIFAFHPVHTESVAWVTERKNTLSVFLYLLAFHAYLSSRLTQILQQSDSRPRWGYYALALGAFILSLLSKSVSASLPAAILVIAWWKTGKVRFKDFLPLLPFFVLGAAMGSVTGWIERHHVGAEGPDWQIGIVSRFLIACRALWFYAGKLIVPYNLSFIYPRWHISPTNAWDWTWVALSALALVAAWWVRGRWRGPLAGCLFFVGTLFPALGFVNVYPMKYSFVADHFQYLASLGVTVPIAVLLWQAPALLRRSPQRTSKPTNSRDGQNRFLLIRGLTVVILASVLATATYCRGLAYKDAETMWRDTLERNPDAFIAHTDLALLLSDSPDPGRIEEAVTHFRAANALRPHDSKILIGLGLALAKTAHAEEGIVEINAGIEAGRSNRLEDQDDGYFTRGLVDMMLHRNEQAAADFRDAIRCAPNHANNHVNLGIVLARLNRYADAVTEYETALRIDPRLFDAQYNLGIAYLGLGDFSQAAAAFQAARNLDPNDPRPGMGLAKIHYGAGIDLLRAHRPGEALREFRNALSVDPQSVEVMNAIARAYEMLGDQTTARAWYQNARRGEMRR